jgi:membrane associated rhomboid family serine protease
MVFAPQHHIADALFQLPDISRPGVIQHELWRLLTCHWVHLSWDHLFGSATTFLGLESLCELMDKKKYYATVAVSGFVSSAHSGMVPVPLAHLVGGVVGTAVGIMGDSTIAKILNQLRPNRHSRLPRPLTKPIWNRILT